MTNDEQQGADGLKPDGTSYRVLVVDDSIIMRKILRKVLCDEQYEICGEAEDGGGVLELYKKLRPDVVTLDIFMDQVDGLTALKDIMGFDKNAKILMLSGAEEKKSIIKAISMGARDYVVKPPDREVLLEKIKKILK
jgi:two-component system chemotaxis response regulator CheY